MSKWENWVESQQRTVEADGVKASIIKLEAPDGSTWGTWAAETEDLCSVINQAVDLLAEDLPKERHSCRLVSYDAKGEQLAIMPHNVTGHSQEAGKSTNRERAHAQATAVQLGNAEQVMGIQHRQLERLNLDTTQLFDDNLVLRQKLVELMTDTLAARTQEKIHEERVTLFRELAATAKPLLEVVIAMGAEFASYKFTEMVEGMKRKQLADESLTGENERLKKELQALQEKVAHEQSNGKPPNGASADSTARAPEAQTDGHASGKRNRGRATRKRGRENARTERG